MLATDRAPLGTTTWLTPSRVGAAAIAWLAVGCVAFAVVLGWPWTHARLTVAIATLAALVTIVVGARASTRASSRGTAFLLGFFTAPVVAGALIFAVYWHQPMSSSLWRNIAMATFEATIAGGMTMLSPLAICQAALGATVVGQLRVPSHETRDRMLARLGAWIALAGAAVGLLVWHRFAWGGIELSSCVLGAWTASMVVLPLVLAGWGFVRVCGRRRWLAAVAQGRVPGWRIVDAGDHDVRGMASFLTAPSMAKMASAKVRVLVETEAAQEPFRDTDRMRPMALVFDDARAE